MKHRWQIYVTDPERVIVVPRGEFQPEGQP